MKLIQLICYLALTLTPALGQTKGGPSLSTLLEELGIDANQTLADLHPELKPVIDATTITDDCYNSQIGPNESANIFRDAVHSIVEKYFVCYRILNFGFQTSLNCLI